ncbi:phage tail assembly protein [Methylobacterium nodulans]|uniref:Uncharacterized protein n=1 Tax=Methylobacterium nodulans (strain LMG 21967 / CNCM I-2342 / ORS 2060) TaxID=460265 RepID=B8IDP2_METNO|nr:phage tail assembly protein [Methylobacterium nodulans]ACL55614.1 conserved hypothetical protein [Methylobacterium nodulans ORS 2060]
MLSFSQLVTNFEPAGKAAPEAPQAAPAPAGAKTPRRRKSPPTAAPSAAQAAPAPEAPPPPEPPVFVGGKPRSAAFPLDFPVQFQGRVYDTVVMRRPTAREVAEFYDALAETGFKGFPIFYTPEGDRIPFEVIENLDPDDDDRIMERLMDFLPRRMLPHTETPNSVSTPASGETTAPTS